MKNLLFETLSNNKHFASIFELLLRALATFQNVRYLLKKYENPSLVIIINRINHV